MCGWMKFWQQKVQIMQFKPRIYSLLMLISLVYSHHALAENNPPLDLIELLGEMGDDDNMLELALAELAQKTSSTPLKDNSSQNKKQTSETAVPAGDSTK